MKKREKGKISNSQLVVAALMNGNNLSSKNISEIIETTYDRQIKFQDVASLLSKISNKKRSDLGFFVKRVRSGNSYTYQVVEEARGLSEQQAYELTLKLGKDRYTLDQAVRDFPGLQKYVDIKLSKPKVRPGPKKKVGKKKGRKSAGTPKSVKAEVLNAMEAPALVEAHIEKLAKDMIQQISEFGGLNLNVRVSVKLEETKD